MARTGKPSSPARHASPPPPYLVYTAITYLSTENKRGCKAAAAAAAAAAATLLQQLHCLLALPCLQVLERPDSLQLAQHWFPQLADAFKPLVRNNTGAAERCPMSERTRAALAELARGEQILYDAALRRVDAMLATLPA